MIKITAIGDCMDEPGTWEYGSLKELKRDFWSDDCGCPANDAIILKAKIGKLKIKIPYKFVWTDDSWDIVDKKDPTKKMTDWHDNRYISFEDLIISLGGMGEQ